MADLGVGAAEGVLVLVVIAVAGILGARWLLSSRRDAKVAQSFEARLDDFEEREEIGRLRHRDFDAFVARVNERRAKTGHEPLSKGSLAPHQYNLMVSVDAGDIDEEAIEWLKNRVVKEAEKPARPPAM